MSDEKNSESPSSNMPRRGWRIAISLFVIYHVICISIWPFDFASGRLGQGLRSAFTDRISQFCRPYSEMLYLRHGYAFFAPDPPLANMLVGYEVAADESHPEVRGTFPNLDNHWPRLLYHRHFMLSEQMSADFVAPNPPPAADAAAQAAWIEMRERYLGKFESFRNHLQHVYGDRPVRMYRLQHLVPPPFEFDPTTVDLHHPESYAIVERDDPAPSPFDPLEPIPGSEPGPPETPLVPTNSLSPQLPLQGPPLVEVLP